MFTKIILLLSLPLWAALYPVDSRTVGLWRFNEGTGNTIADVSGNNLNATKTGGTWVTGVDSNCVSLNYNEYATVTNNSKLHYFNKITAESWVYLTGANINTVDHEDIIGKGDAAPFGGYHLCVLYSPGGYNFHFYVESDTGGSTMGGVVDPAVYTFNQWFYVAGVYDGDSVHVYVNGTKTASSYCKLGRIGTVNGNLFINHHTWSNEGLSSSRLQGKFDEIRISDTARTASDIKKVWDRTSYGPVAFYPFTGNANDASGNGNNGTVTGATLSIDKLGNANQAYSFDGTDYISCGSGTSFQNITNLTVAAWVKTTNSGSYMSICSRDEDGFGRQWQFVRNDFNQVHFSTCSAVGVWDSSSSATIINDGYWHFVVGARTNDSIKLYVDGVKKGGKRLANPMATVTNCDVMIGSTRDNTSNNWVGSIDEVRIYNRAISVTEVDSLFNLMKGPNGPIAYYPFNGNANDLSGNGNNATVYSATLTTDRFGNSNSAYNFDGSLSYIDAGRIDGIFGNYSIAGWFKTTEQLNNKGIVSIDDVILLEHNLTRTTDTSGFRYVNFSSELWTNLELNDGQWHMFTATKSADSVKLYIDDSLVAKKADASYPTYFGWTLFGKRDRVSTAYMFKGDLDDIRITNYPMSAQEVDSLYRLGSFINNAPQFISSAPTTATEDSPYTYSITVVDVDLDDTVTLSLDSLPTGMTITGNVINWTPTNSNVGLNRVVIRARDNHGAYTQQKFTIAVTNTNDAPVITSTPPIIATQNLVYQYPIVATDVDVGDAKTYAFATNPTGMAVSSTGLITWTPNSGQIGVHNVKIYVRDASLAADSQSWSITVGNINDAPIISTLVLDTASEDIAYVDTVKATDPDGNLVFWSLLKGPDSLKINLTTGEITWTPLDKDAGNDTVRVRATDGVLSDTATFILHVIRVNDAPQITCTFPDSLKQDSLYLISLKASDEEHNPLSWSILDKPSNMQLIDTTVIWAPNSSNLGIDTISIIVSDGSLTDTLVAIFTVYTLGTKVEDIIPIPTELSLNASPNPANPNVNLTVGIPASAKQAIVQIVGINGKTVRSWKLQGAGYHNITWNANNDQNTAISSGLYVVRVTGAGKILQRKVLLLK